MSTKFAGADWLARSWDETLSPFHVEVADILGQVFRGIYHIDHALKRKLWFPNYVELRLDSGGLATWDFNELTTLVVLCHDRCIRLAVNPCSPRHIRLTFHQRKREGGMAERHPKLNDHIAEIRAERGLGEV